MHKRTLLWMVVALLSSSALSLTGCSKAKKESIELTNQGVRAFERKQWDAAYSYFERATEIYPENAQAYYHMGLIDLYERDQGQQAFNRLQQAKELDPNDRDILFSLGRARLEKMDDAAGAIEEFDAAIAIDPNYHPAWFHKAKALIDLGKFDEADAALRETIAIDPTYARAFVELAALYERFEHEDAAKAVYEEGIRHNRSDPDLINGLGVLLMKAGKYKEAIEQFRDVIARDQTRMDSLFNLAFGYVQLGEKKAKTEGEEAKKKEVQKAIRYLDKFIAMANTPENAESIRAARALKRALSLEMYQ